jgi:hypothetical protein
VLAAGWSPVLEDPVFPPLLFAVLGFAWVLQRREEPRAEREVTQAAGGRD